MLSKYSDLKTFIMDKYSHRLLDLVVCDTGNSINNALWYINQDGVHRIKIHRYNEYQLVSSDLDNMCTAYHNNICI